MVRDSAHDAHAALASYLVRCGERREDGSRCPNYVPLFPGEKSVCAACGAVHASWTDYAESRTKTGVSAMHSFPKHKPPFVGDPP